MAQQGATGQTATAGGRARRTRAWTEVSLRAKLLSLALVSVTVPGVLFAIFAFAGTLSALEREIGVRLRQNAERGAEGVSAALARARADADAWARQDLMRDLTVGDVDKRVSQFLHRLRSTGSPYVAVLCVDAGGAVVAASGGEWIGRPLSSPLAQAAVADAPDAPAGPLAVDEVGREVLVFAAPIVSPDPPGARLGTLLLLYDWADVVRQLDVIRAPRAGEGRDVAAFVADRDGVAVGGAPLSVATDASLDAPAYGRGVSRRAGEDPQPVLVGAAPVGVRGWAVLVVERTREAFAAVDRVRGRWIAMLAALVLAGLAAAALLARQILRPLSEVTTATAELAAHPDRPTPPLPVRSSDEVGRLSESFNRMTAALRDSREEALSAAKFSFAGQLAAMVAHEVRTPLAVMRSSAQLLADPSLPPAQHAELAETIVAEVDRIERVVSELIQLARPLEPRFEATPLDELLARAAAIVAPQARRQQVAVVREPALAPRPAATASSSTRWCSTWSSTPCRRCRRAGASPCAPWPPATARSGSRSTTTGPACRRRFASASSSRSSAVARGARGSAWPSSPASSGPTRGR
ncbi:MAG: HAMP domain-containing sensor histidine kinase [Candidatus Binatia bacterium]